MTVFSFHPVKHLTTGEGGMVTTDNASFAETLRRFRNHGINSDARERQREGQWHYEMVLARVSTTGLPTSPARLASNSCRRLEANLARRREIAARYTSELRNIPGIVIPQVVRSDALPAWHLYPIRVDRRSFRPAGQEFFGTAGGKYRSERALHSSSSPSLLQRTLWISGGEFPVAEKAYESLISLPMFHGMTDQDVGDVIEAVDSVVSFYRSEMKNERSTIRNFL